MDILLALVNQALPIEEVDKENAVPVDDVKKENASYIDDQYNFSSFFTRRPRITSTISSNSSINETKDVDEATLQRDKKIRRKKMVQCIPVDENTKCYNCGTIKTSRWRSSLSVEGQRECNACCQYFEIHGIRRQEHLWQKDVKRRKVTDDQESGDINEDKSIIITEDVNKENAVPVDDKESPGNRLSYSKMAALAIESSSTGQLHVSDIYDFIYKHFPYFCTCPVSWKNRVRSALSRDSKFQKIEIINGNGRKRYEWSIDPARKAKVDIEDVDKENAVPVDDVNKEHAAPVDDKALHDEDVDEENALPVDDVNKEHAAPVDDKALHDEDVDEENTLPVDDVNKEHAAPVDDKALHDEDVDEENALPVDDVNKEHAAPVDDKALHDEDVAEENALPVDDVNKEHAAPVDDKALHDEVVDEENALPVDDVNKENAAPVDDKALHDEVVDEENALPVDDVNKENAAPVDDKAKDADAATLQRDKKIRRKRMVPCAWVDENTKCYNCGTTKTSLWRSSWSAEGQRECNACCQYFSKYGTTRPEHLWKTEIKRRKLTDDQESGAIDDNKEQHEKKTSRKKIAQCHPVDENTKCANCGTKKTSFWRSSLSVEGQRECNACWQHFSKYGTKRPEHLWQTDIKRRCGRVTAGYNALISAGIIKCVNCGVKRSTSWHRNGTPDTICRSCYEYFRYHGVNRPEHKWTHNAVASGQSLN